MAGELLFRIVKRDAAARFVQQGRRRYGDNGETKSFKELFLDHGQTSLVKPTGFRYVVLDGSAFFEDAPWLYEDHADFAAPFGEEDTSATLVVPREVVARWREALGALPASGKVARQAPHVRDALIALMETVLADDTLGLTVESLL